MGALGCVFDPPPHLPAPFVASPSRPTGRPSYGPGLRQADINPPSPCGRSDLSDSRIAEELEGGGNSPSPSPSSSRSPFKGEGIKKVVSPFERLSERSIGVRKADRVNRIIVLYRSRVGEMKWNPPPQIYMEMAGFALPLKGYTHPTTAYPLLLHLSLRGLPLLGEER